MQKYNNKKKPTIPVKGDGHSETGSLKMLITFFFRGIYCDVRSGEQLCLLVFSFWFFFFVTRERKLSRRSSRGRQKKRPRHVLNHGTTRRCSLAAYNAWKTWFYRRSIGTGFRKYLFIQTLTDPQVTEEQVYLGATGLKEAFVLMLSSRFSGRSLADCWLSLLTVWACEETSAHLLLERNTGYLRS